MNLEVKKLLFLFFFLTYVLRLWYLLTFVQNRDKQDHPEEISIDLLLQFEC